MHRRLRSIATACFLARADESVTAENVVLKTVLFLQNFPPITAVRSAGIE
jgi:hypothetical protein